MTSGTRQAAYWLIFSALCSALMGASVRWIRDDIDWRVIVFARTSVGLAVALLLVRTAGAQVPWPGPRELWVRSGAGAIAILCTFYGATRIPVADATVLVNSSPIWLAALSAVVLGHRPQRSAWYALALGTLGIVLIARPHFAERNFGALAAATTGFLISISLLSIGRMRHVHAAAIVAHASAACVLTSGLVLLSALADLNGGFLRSPKVMFGLVAIGTLGTLLQVGMTRAYATGNAVRLGPLQYVAVAFAAAFDTLLFDDAPAPMTLAGIMLVIAPSMWVMTRPREAAHVRSREVPRAPELDPGALSRLEAAIQRAEKLSSCEVRVHVERSCSDRSVRPRQVFDELGMQRTKLRNGVLVYLALESRIFAVVVDEGISDLVPSDLLDDACQRVTDAMAHSELVDAVAEGIVDVSARLGSWFPYQPDDVNELEDSISVAW